jgi:hypothetical protein
MYPLDTFSEETKKELEAWKDQEVKKVVSEIISLSDRIECENESVFDEWRAFKQFRNTLRDKYFKK